MRSLIESEEQTLLSKRPADAEIYGSYLQQAQLSQKHRFLAAIRGTEAHQAPNQLVAHGFKGQLDEQPLSMDERGLPDLPTNHANNIKVSDISYVGSDPLLPRIVQLKLVSNTKNKALTNLAASAVPHRLLSLKHRWHALGESPIKTAPPYQQIITNNFVMDWGTGSVRSYTELADWLANSASSMATARHDIAKFEWSEKATSQFQAIFEFDWYGISQSGKAMQAKSRHTWQIEDDNDEPYARIDHMDVEFLVPFHSTS